MAAGEAGIGKLKRCDALSTVTRASLEGPRRTEARGAGHMSAPRPPRPQPDRCTLTCQSILDMHLQCAVKGYRLRLEWLMEKDSADKKGAPGGMTGQ